MWERSAAAAAERASLPARTPGICLCEFGFLRPSILEEILRWSGQIHNIEKNKNGNDCVQSERLSPIFAAKVK